MTTTNRRHAMRLLATAASIAALPALAASPAKTPMEVWKDPSCGCCKDWAWAHAWPTTWDLAKRAKP